MSFVLFDDDSSLTLRPFTFTRPVAGIRIGILTIAEKWTKYLDGDASFLVAGYLQALFPAKPAPLYINGAVCPDADLADAVLALRSGQRLTGGGMVLAIHSDADTFPGDVSGYDNVSFNQPFTHLRHPEDIFRFNEAELKKDFQLLTHGRNSGDISGTNTVLGNEFFAEPGATAECSTFNTLRGPVYLGRNAEVWEGCQVRGAFALCEGAQVKMGAKIYGATTIGPACRVGGEVNNSVMFGYSSKGHEGYLGNSVLGEWCNIGAGTDNSNMKNNYSTVKIWDYAGGSFRDTGLQFCGLFMGDHAKCGIGTMFNTGTVAGPGANIYGGGYQPKFIPGFSWGGDGEKYEASKFIQTVESVFKRRERALSDEEKKVLLHLLAD